MPVFTYKINIEGKWDTQESGGVTYTEACIHEPYVIATGTTDELISMGGVTTASFLYIKSDQTITINFNSNTGTNISILANKPFLASGCAVTAIYASNSSGANANTTMVIAGA
jgi:hypothetical protein